MADLTSVNGILDRNGRPFGALLSLSLSRDYGSCFARVLESVARWQPHGDTRQLNACWPEFASGYCIGEGILVVGRATNGFDDHPFDVSAVSDPIGREVIAAHARAFAEAREGKQLAPLSWLANTGSSGSPSGTVASRSAFWRVICRFVECSEIMRRTDGHWWHGLGWTNLAKVAPSAGGNPPHRLWQIQREAAVAALRREIEEAQPQLVVAFFGESWLADVQDLLGLAIRRHPNGIAAIGTGTDGDRPWLLCHRPERRAERPFVEDLLRSCSEL